MAAKRFDGAVSRTLFLNQEHTTPEARAPPIPHEQADGNRRTIYCRVRREQHAGYCRLWRRVERAHLARRVSRLSGERTAGCFISCGRRRRPFDRRLDAFCFRLVTAIPSRAHRARLFRSGCLRRVGGRRSGQCLAPDDAAQASEPEQQRQGRQASDESTVFEKRRVQHRRFELIEGRMCPPSAVENFSARSNASRIAPGL